MEQSKQKIFFKDLIFTVLYQWKALVITMILFALLLGGFAVMSNQDATVSVGGTSMTPENTALVEELETQVKWLNNNIESQKTHNKECALMKLDSFQAYTAVVQLYVTPADYNADSYDNTAALLQTYKALLLDANTLDQMAKAYGMSTSCLRELITVTAPEERYLQITVYADSQEQADDYIVDIVSAFERCADSVIAKVGEHSVTTSTYVSGPKVDTSLYDKQNTSLTKIKNWESDLAATKTRLNQYAPTIVTAATMSPVLFAIIGAFLGAVIVVVWVWCCYICGDKVYNAKVLANRTGVRILGCVASSKKRDFLTRWFRKLDGRAQHTDAEAAAVNVRNLCKDAKKVLFMGTFEAEVVNCITEKLQTAGVESVVCPDPSVKADALEALPTCDAVVLAETCAKSSYESVEWAIQTVADHEKPLLGCVLIDG